MNSPTAGSRKRIARYLTTTLASSAPISPSQQFYFTEQCQVYMIHWLRCDVIENELSLAPDKCTLKSFLYHLCAMQSSLLGN